MLLRAGLMHHNKTPSFDHLVGTAKERQRNCDAEDFRGLEIQAHFDS